MRDQVLDLKGKILFEEVFHSKELVRIIIHDSVNFENRVQDLLFTLFVNFLGAHNFSDVLCLNLKNFHIM